jgi:threonine dehydrogenase-like Zn-dependent dehydrogenase
MITAYTLNGDGTAPRKIKLEKPHLEPGELLIETVLTEVCGTDLHLQSGSMKNLPYPVIPGHFFVGRVIELNGGKQDIDGNPVKVGDMLTFLDVHGTCGICWNCTTGNVANKCNKREVYGVTHGADEGPLGGWSEKILIKRDVLCAILPPNLTPERYIIAGCALPTALHGIERAQIQLHDTVLVQGAGPVGINLAILARASGAGKVIIVDKNMQRLEKAKQLGFDSTILAADDVSSVLEQIKAITGRMGCDVVLEATGVPAAIKDGMELTRDGGTYIVVGQYSDNGDIAINPHNHINRKHITVKGVWGIELRHFRKMLDVLSNPTATLDPSIWDRLDIRFYPLDEVAVALNDVKQGKLTKAGIRVQA